MSGKQIVVEHAQSHAARAHIVQSSTEACVHDDVHADGNGRSIGGRRWCCPNHPSGHAATLVRVASVPSVPCWSNCRGPCGARSIDHESTVRSMDRATDRSIDRSIINQSVDPTDNELMVAGSGRVAGRGAGRGWATAWRSGVGFEWRGMRGWGHAHGPGKTTSGMWWDKGRVHWMGRGGA